MKNIFFISIIFFAFGVTTLWANPNDKPKQKVFLFLKEPIRDEESIVIRLNSDIEENIELPSQDKNLLNDGQQLYKIIYQKKQHGGKNEILIDLLQGGLVVLDVYDFYGKKLGNLFSGYQAPGLLVLDENESWKAFNRFKGIVYFTLTVDGRLVTKKLVAKVE